MLLLALDSGGTVAILDDHWARRVAEAVGIGVIGTLGILLEAKRAGLPPTVSPLLDELNELGFRLSPRTRDAILRLAGGPGLTPE